MRHMFKRVMMVVSIFVLMGSLVPTTVVFGQDQPNLIDLDQIEPLKSDASIDELIDGLPDSAQMDNPYLVLVNNMNPIEEDMTMNFAQTSDGKKYHATISVPFNQLLEAANKEGHPLTVVSAYRTMAEQEANRNYQINSYINDGASEADARQATDLYYANTNSSEHATGLAFDLVGKGWDGGLTEEFAEHESAVWLADNAHKFGFILRYLEGKSDVTGYNYEPWHFRYVGYENAEYIYQHGITLEEFLALINERDQRQKRIENQLLQQKDVQGAD